jgi:hypothetical protein
MTEIIFIAFVAAGVTIFTNYCIGKPASEFSPYEIFSGYTVLLSIRRLKVVGIYDTYRQQYEENLSRMKTKSEIINLKNEFKKMLYNAADPFFTWERAAGMCPVCTGFWISLFIGILVNQNISGIIEIIVLSHILIRITNKIL